ncbi:unnamed protein product [Trichogramma brassicae]|uniref:CCHC-type domain-containing protein n=1 Tax=Trichogramma brassicae TaxID=86971 RepID=A0A6H5HVW6_9HYME|nr:unnamed protein product [Trichogramma brassicae]
MSLEDFLDSVEYAREIIDGGEEALLVKLVRTKIGEEARKGLKDIDIKTVAELKKQLRGLYSSGLTVSALQGLLAQQIQQPRESVLSVATKIRDLGNQILQTKKLTLATGAAIPKDFEENVKGSQEECFGKGLLDNISVRMKFTGSLTDIIKEAITIEKDLEVKSMMRRKLEKRCGNCGRTNHATEQCRVKRVNTVVPTTTNTHSNAHGNGSKKCCTYCKKPGHLADKCFKYVYDQVQKAKGSSKPSADSNAQSPCGKYDVQRRIQQCLDCQLKKLVRLKTRQPMIITDTPGVPFEKVALDIKCYKNRPLCSALQHTTMIEVRDLNECATKKEISEELGKSLGAPHLNEEVSKTLRKAYAGTQAAVAALPDDLATKALKLGHIRIGWVNCRIRGREDALRCYRCWSPGHVLARCTGPDRSAHCFRCGQTGHRIKDCKNSPACVFCQEQGAAHDHASTEEHSSPLMMRILQLNLNHCRAAQDLLSQTILEQRINVSVLCDQYKNLDPPYWLSDANSQATIWAHGGCLVQERPARARPFFTRARINGIYFFSVYAPPRLADAEFTALLTNIIEEAWGKRPLIFAGDFNAWSTEWGCRETRRRATALLDAFAALEAVLLNTGDMPTFTGPLGYSVIDLTFASDTLAPQITSWAVSELYTHSDHQAIVFEIKTARPPRPSTRQSCKWNARTLDTECLSVMMAGTAVPPGPAEEMATSLMAAITGACDASMTKRGGRRRRGAVYWWTSEIADLRRSCLRARRLAQRAHGRPNEDACRASYASARCLLRAAIKTSKRLCWNKLCDEVNEDVWGKPYETVMSRLRGPRVNSPSSPSLVRRIVAALFPRVPDEPALLPPPQAGAIVPAVTLEELRGACRRINDHTAPGPDGVPNSALKIAIDTRPDIFLQVYTACLRTGVFPACWKRQRLVLLPKPGKPPEEPSSYRPLCMLDTAGKILERIICDRLEAITESPEGLSDHQYGFRKGRSTINAIESVIAAAREAIAGKRWNRGTKKYCAVVTLDVKNAFNSARWNSIYAALHRMRTPEYLPGLQVINSKLEFIPLKIPQLHVIFNKT